MSWFSANPVNDIDRGRQAMVYFHNQMLGFSNYKMSLDQCINTAAKGRPEIFLDALGFAATAITLRDSAVKEAMENLASKSAGVVPNNLSLYTNAFSERAQNISAVDWFIASPTIATDTFVDAAKGAQAVGNAVIDTGKSLLVIGPILIIAAIVFIGYSRTRMIAGR